MSTCASAKFNNLLRFRGFPFLPKPETGTTGPNLRESAEGYGGSPGFEGGGVVIPRGLQTPVVPVRL